MEPRFALLVLLALIASCGGPQAAKCVEGASLACACTDGRTGAQVCDSQGVLGPCSCGVVGDAGGVTGNAGDGARPEGPQGVSLGRQVDVLFMIDNSPTMKEEQGLAGAAMSRFIEALRRSPGGLPDLHVGIVTSDLGAGSKPLGNGGCPIIGGDRGILQAKAGCGLESGATFISSANHGSMNNFTGGIEQVFSCMANVGTAGCGYEHQLESVTVALDARLAPANKGFLREDAFLVIVLVTDEDDCSAATNSDLFTDDAAFPMTTGSFRCAQVGHLCQGAPPPVAVFDAPLTSCQANPGGRLLPISEVVASIRALKRRPDQQILVSGIFGWPASLATARYRYVQTASAIDFAPICQSAQGEATAGLRLKAFVEAFGPSGVFQSICETDFSPALQKIADLLAARM